MMISQFVFFFSLSFIDGAVNLYKKKWRPSKIMLLEMAGKNCWGKYFLEWDHNLKWSRLYFLLFLLYLLLALFSYPSSFLFLFLLLYLPLSLFLCPLPLFFLFSSFTSFPTFYWSFSFTNIYSLSFSFSISCFSYLTISVPFLFVAALI